MPRMARNTFLLPLVLFACGAPDKTVDLYAAPVAVDVASVPLDDGTLTFEITLTNTGTGDGEITTLAVSGDEAAYLQLDPSLELPIVLEAGAVVHLPVVVADLSALPEGWFEAPLSLDVTMASTWTSSGCNASAPASDSLSVPIILTRPLGCDEDGDGYNSVDCGGDDCDDTSDVVFPGGIEICDGLDNDCNGTADGADAFDAVDWFLDSDGDTYGAGTAVRDCAAPDTDWVQQDGDCDDASADVSPAATEVCNGIDDDCDTRIDGADGSLDLSTRTTYYADRDGDGFGDDASTTASCSRPVGYVVQAGDCDDQKTYVNPNADESCISVGGRAIDEDCDGATDEASAVDATTWYADRDGDRFGDAASSRTTCAAPLGYVADNTDCNDNNTDSYPGAPELCNGASDDCDAAVDEGAGLVYYADRDGDGWGDDGDSRVSCTAVAGFVTQPGDCNDANALYNPGQDDPCDDPEDYDCDGAPEDGCSTCAELLEGGFGSTDGVYTLDVDSNGDGSADSTMDAYCDMTTDGGGWTLVQRTVWEFSESSQLLTGFDAWATSSVGAPDGGGAYRMAGERWEGLAAAGDLLAVERVRTQAGGACGPLFYKSTGGTLSVDSASAAASFTGLTHNGVSLAAPSLSTADSGPGSACTARGMVAWFYSSTCGCSSCPTFQGPYWADEAHPMAGFVGTLADLNGNVASDVCTGTPRTADNGSAFVGIDSMEYYLR